MMGGVPCVLHQTYKLLKFLVLLLGHYFEAGSDPLPQSFYGGVTGGVMRKRRGLLTSDQLAQSVHGFGNEFPGRIRVDV